MKYTYLFTLIFFSTSLLAFSNECRVLEEKLRKAERSYTDGDLYRVIDLLNSIENENSKLARKCPEVWRDAFSLLSKVYLLTNEEEKASENYIKVLKIDPSYKLSKTLEPTDMIYFANRYRATPLFSITPSVSLVQTSIINKSEGNSIDAFFLEEDPVSTIFFSFPTYGANIRASFYPTRHWELSGNIGFDNKEYEMDQIYIRDGLEDATSQVLLIKEHQSWSYLGGMVRYNIGKRGINVNVFGGYKGERLNKAVFEEARRGDFNLITELESYGYDKIDSDKEEKHLDVMDLREKYHSSAFVGVGLKIRPPASKKHFITFDLETGRSMNYFNRGKTGKLNGGSELDDILFYGLGYMEDELKIRYFQFSVGYSYTIYRVVKSNRKLWFL